MKHTAKPRNKHTGALEATMYVFLQYMYMYIHVLVHVYDVLEV